VVLAVLDCSRALRSARRSSKLSGASPPFMVRELGGLCCFPCLGGQWG
jgi:hypothetical protein